MSRRRKKHITTKNTHGGMTSKKVTSALQMKQLESEQMENFKGQKIGINYCIKLPYMDEPIVGAGVYAYDGFEKLHKYYLEKLALIKKENEIEESDKVCGQAMIYQLVNEYVKKNGDGTGVIFNKDVTEQLVEFTMSFSMLQNECQVRLANRFNKYMTLTMDFVETENGDGVSSHNEWELHSTFEEFSAKGEELVRLVNPNYENVSVLYNTDRQNTNKIDVDDFEDDDIEPVDYSVDDIEIIEDAVVPIMGVQYEVLLKLKNSMTILEIGQTIKIPRDERLRSTIYQLNKKYFPNKKFSVVQLEDNFIVFLNPNRKDRINQL